MAHLGSELLVIRPGARAHLLLIDVDGPELMLTPIAGLLDDGQPHLMTALTPAMSSSSRL